MPKFSGVRAADWHMGTVYGGAGKTRPMGVMRHRFELDLSTHPGGTDVIYEVFRWGLEVDPIMLLYASFTWNLADTNFDAGEIGIGSDGGANDIIPATPIDLAGNDSVIGSDIVLDIGPASLFVFTQGTVPHKHWTKPLSGFAGLDPTVASPIKLNVVGSAAGTSDPITGYVRVHLLWASLRTF